MNLGLRINPNPSFPKSFQVNAQEPGPVPPVLRKFMMAVRVDMYDLLEREAMKREVTVQELLRAVILPDWMKKNSRSSSELDEPDKSQAQENPVGRLARGQTGYSLPN